jgi:hypothetical protein
MRHLRQPEVSPLRYIKNAKTPTLFELSSSCILQPDFAMEYYKKEG